jgi:hypothetical protein
MKNIHALEKDIFKRFGVDHYGKTQIQIKISEFLINKNIYITSDEEIKEGDYGILGKTILSYHQMHKKWGMPQGKKIILTTDQELINYGVQPIPDEFLEWFVKNPSCEEVEVREEEVFVGFIDGNGKKPIYDDEYKIIIPKEKGINSWSGEKGVKGVNGIECFDGIREPKQSAVEWLEEVYNKCPAYEESILEQEWKQAKEMERQKDAKYNEMLEMVKKLMAYMPKNNIDDANMYYEALQLIKEATEI